MKKSINGLNYKFFWNGPFSNWFPCEFIVDNITYNCGEQYMMHQKAILFGDYAIAEKILSLKSPKEQKQLGRLVKNYNDKIWNEKRFEIVKRGLVEKFKQNSTLMNELRKYSNCIFVEASPYDRIWGIGYLDKDAEKNFDNWGLNLLGKILTEINNELL